MSPKLMRTGWIRPIRLSTALAFVLAACVGTGGGASASPSPRAGGSVVLAAAEPFDGWKPDSATAYITYQVDELVMAPLLRFGADGKTLEPGLASSWTSTPDGLTYTFKLADGVTFSNGTPVTSADVAFSAEQWKKGTNFGFSYSPIDKVLTPDPKTAVFQLNAPYSILPLVMSWSVSGIIPKDFGGLSMDNFYKQPIGAGPFQIQTYDPGNKIILTRNPHYYRQGRPYLDQVTIVQIRDNNSRVLQFQNKNVDIMHLVPPDVAKNLDAKDLIVSSPHLQWFATMNTTAAPFNDLALRRAVADAIDPTTFASVFPKYSDASVQSLPLNVRNSVPGTQPWRYDAAAAGQELAASKHPDGAKVDLVFNSEDGMSSLYAQVLQQQLGKIKVNVTLVGQDQASLLDKLFTGHFDMGIWSTGAISPDVIDPTAFVIGTNHLFSGLSTAELSKNYTAYTSTSDQTAQQKIVVKIEDDMRTAVPYVPLVNQRALTAVQPYVHGIQVAPWTLFYMDDIWVSK